MSEPPRQDTAAEPHRPLSLPIRILLHLLGWTLVGVGLAGLVLPGIQGLLTVALGLATVSVASQTVHRWLRALFRRWPRAAHWLEHFRNKVHDKLQRKR